MFANFMFAVNAVVPLVLLMALGYVFRVKGFLTLEFFQGCEKLVFKLMLPATLFCNIYTIESFSHVKWDIVVYVVCAIFIVMGAGVALCSLTVRNRLSRGAAVQCVFRSNTALVGLPLATSLGGEAASSIMSVALGFGVPVLNLLSVCVLSVYSGSKKVKLSQVLRKIVTNPLIAGCLLGLLALAVRAALPRDAAGEPVFSLEVDLKVLYSAIETLGSMASPVALLAIGGQLHFTAAAPGSLKNILVGSLGRMVLAPALVISLAYLLDKVGLLALSSADYAVLLPFFGSPVAVSSAIMASEMGSDADLARQYSLWTSLLLIVTLPVLIMAMRVLGLL